MKPKFDTKSLVLLGLLNAIVVIFSMTPIGSIPVGVLVITLNVIPIGLAAVTMGEWGGLIVGTFFGIFSFLQCFGIGVPSGMGAILVEINPFLAFVQRVVPRALDGFVVGLFARLMSQHMNFKVTCFITGFLAAFLNTAFFMSALVLLFKDTDYIQGLMGTKNFFAFVIGFVGINALVEMAVCCFFTGTIGSILHLAGLIKTPKKTAAAAK